MTMSDILDQIEKRAANEEQIRSEKLEAASKAREEKMAKLIEKLKK